MRPSVLPLNSDHAYLLRYCLVWRGGSCEDGVVCEEWDTVSHRSIDTRDATLRGTSLPTARGGKCCEIETGDEGSRRQKRAQKGWAAIVFLTCGRTGLPAA